MNVEDAIIAKKRKRVERMEAEFPCHPCTFLDPLKHKLFNLVI